MRLFADENIPASSVRVLRTMGNEVSYACEICPGSPDNRVMELARHESSVLLTFDRDFGQLLFNHAGKISHEAAFHKAHEEYEKFWVQQLAEPTEVEKHFVEVEKEMKQIEVANKRKA